MLKIGSRGSALALAQSNWVRETILQRFPDTEISIRIIRTSADRDTKTSLRSSSSTGVFVKEIEEALMRGEIDLAVHSMKDVPTRVPESLDIAAIPAREDARDALIARDGIRRLRDLPPGCVVGTGSIRRQAQLLASRPDLQIRDIRGNVDTRLRKLDDGEYDAIVLACAGLNRLGLQDRISAPIGFRQMLIAPGQGALAIEIRKDDAKVLQAVAPLNHEPSAAAVNAERAFLRRMGGGCNIPVAGHATVVRGRIRLQGLVAAPDGTKVIRKQITQTPRLAEKAAVELAERILDAGGREILQSLR